MRRLRKRDEHGAVAVFTAIILVFLMLPALLITVDVGRVFAERRQLQNGADAAALAVAQSCAEGGDCDPSFAQTYADPNANDGAHDIPLPVCGTAGDLPACGGPSGGGLTHCLPLPADPPEYVQVHTSTDAPAGLLFFSPEDKTIGACARASLGGARTATGLAFTISFCEWDVMTSSGDSFGSSHDIPTHNDPDGECPVGSGSGYGDAPGGFGWLDSPGGDCQSTVDTEGAYAGDVGGDTPTWCRDLLKQLVDSAETIFIPIFGEVEGNGANAVYQFEGWAAFVLTGFWLPAVPGGAYGEGCPTLGKPCIRGYFTEALITDPDAVVGGSDEFGASLIGLVG